MENSKKLMEQAGVIPKLQLGIQKPGGGVIPTGPHRVKLVSDRIISEENYETGKEEPHVVYTIEENGVTKEYHRKVKNKKGELDYLVQRLANLEPGHEVILEMARKGARNHIVVIPVDSDEGAEEDDQESIEA